METALIPRTALIIVEQRPDALNILFAQEKDLHAQKASVHVQIPPKPSALLGKINMSVLILRQVMLIADAVMTIATIQLVSTAQPLLALPLANVMQVNVK
jgi:hypothetical protein